MVGLYTHNLSRLRYHKNSAMQSQKTVSAYFTSKQIVPSGFATICTASIYYGIIVVSSEIYDISLHISNFFQKIWNIH